MKIYKVSTDYLNFLREFDAKVPHSYGGRKPFVGIILPVGEHQYIAPLTSHKEKHNDIPDSQPNCVKLHELSDPSNRLGMIQLNNMVPILPSTIALLDFEDQDPKYKKLLQMQYAYIKTVKDDINKKSSLVYNLSVIKKHPFFVKWCCDFKTLEENYSAFGAPGDL